MRYMKQKCLFLWPYDLSFLLLLNIKLLYCIWFYAQNTAPAYAIHMTICEYFYMILYMYVESLILNSPSFSFWSRSIIHNNKQSGVTSKSVHIGLWSVFSVEGFRRDYGSPWDGTLFDGHCFFGGRLKSCHNWILPSISPK